MKQLLKGKSGLWLALVFWVSRASSAIAGLWSRGFPPINSWLCLPSFSWDQGWLSLLLTIVFWAAIIVVCILVVKRLFFRKRRNPSVSASAYGLSISCGSVMLAGRFCERAHGFEKGLAFLNCPGRNQF
jgi:hypothetical protein